MDDPQQLERSTARIAADVRRLAAPPFAPERGGLRRHAFTSEYVAATSWLAQTLGDLGMHVECDAAGNLYGRNRPPGVPCVGIGSHLDAVRDGGDYDGVLGVVAAIEVARLAAERGIDIPLQVTCFAEEEGAGFGRLLLGSAAATGQVGPTDLAALQSIDDGRSYAEHAAEQGLDVGGIDDRAVRDLGWWMELHIEQGRRLCDAGLRVGVVDAIAGMHHVDLRFTGRADHAGATPMDLRCDPSVPAAVTIVELEAQARAAGRGAVATVGAITVEPGAINVIPRTVALTVDVRAPHDDTIDSIIGAMLARAQREATSRGVDFEHRVRQRVPATTLHAEVAAALQLGAERAAVPYATLHSGAVHDTMLVAARVPSAMVFVACRDGVSHSADEWADPADAAIGAHLMLNAAQTLAGK